MGSLACVVSLACAAALAACGGDSTASGTTTQAPVAGPITTASPGASATAPPQLERPALWPAADVVFATPAEAAADFVVQVLRVSPTLGELTAADARSGEIVVLSAGEEGGRPIARGTLQLRRLGPSDGWFVVAAVGEDASITAPAPLADVAAGPVTVEGVARGFEATVVVSALVAGHAGEPLDEQITHGGAHAEAEPFRVTLDLLGAVPGQIVTLLVRGDAGLETDPGDFAAIAVRIAGG